MADYYTKISFAFKCTDTEALVLTEAGELDGLDLADIDWREDVSAELLAVFPTKDDFKNRVCLGDDFVSLSATIGTYEPSTVWVHSHDAMLEGLVNLIQAVCQDTLKQTPIGFQWANDCSKDRLDAYGGGFVAIFHDRTVWGNTSTLLDAALEGEE